MCPKIMSFLFVKDSSTYARNVCHGQPCITYECASEVAVGGGCVQQDIHDKILDDAKPRTGAYTEVKSCYRQEYNTFNIFCLFCFHS